jgi:transposase-like protein
LVVELRRVKKELARVTEERDILKEATTKTTPARYRKAALALPAQATAAPIFTML